VQASPRPSAHRHGGGEKEKKGKGARGKRVVVWVELLKKNVGHPLAVLLPGGGAG
jgi:hypothetical protein